MTLNSANVRIGITGELYKAPTGTPRPANSTAALNAAYVGQGYVSEDGVTESPDETVERVTAWQGGAVVRSTTTEATVTISLTLIETKASVLETYHKGSAVASLGGGQYKIDVKPPTEKREQYILDVLDGTKHLRFDIPDGEVTERGEITYATAEAIAYPVTITCYPVNGVLYTKYSDDAAWA
jgi:hypothetical protein